MASWLSTMTSSGRLYEIDLRLRPDGDAGLLAVSIDAFSQYQTQHAWVWEHQAINRPRLATGAPNLGRPFEDVRRHVILLPSAPQQPKHKWRALPEQTNTVRHTHTPDCDLTPVHGLS